jgi:general stress protein YciG
VALARVVSSLQLRFMSMKSNNPTEFAHGKVDPSEAGRKGGKSS